VTATATDACPSCLALVDSGDRFCEVCGIILPAPEPPNLPEPPEPPEAAAVAGVPCVVCGDVSPQIDGYCPTCGTKAPSVRDHLEDVHRDAAGVTNRGRRHPRNEDAFALATTTDGRVLAVVCDGVSTTASADEASQRAADAALAVLLGSAGPSRDGHSLDDAFNAARHAVGDIAWSFDTNELGSPSCTFLAASVGLGVIELVSVGDCRAFWVPGHGEAQTLTEDDSWAAEQVRTAAMTAESAYADPRSHAITRWLGGDADPSWEPRRIEFAAPGPGRLVLCTDGLWNYAPSAAEVASLAAEGDPITAGRRLVEHANQRGGHDNITVVVVEIAAPTDIPEATAKGPLP